MLVFTGLFEVGDVDDVELQPARVEEADDLADGRAADELAAGHHGLD